MNRDKNDAANYAGPVPTEPHSENNPRNWELANLAYDVLRERARDGSIITFTDLAKRIGTGHRNIHGSILDRVEWIGLDKDPAHCRLWTLLVVSGTGEPPRVQPGEHEGIPGPFWRPISEYGVRSDQLACFAYARTNWPKDGASN